MSRITGLKAGDIVTCTRAFSPQFTVGKDYKVTTHLNIVNNNGRRYRVSPILNLTSTFVKKETTAIATITPKKSVTTIDKVKKGDILLCTKEGTSKFTKGKMYKVCQNRTTGNMVIRNNNGRFTSLTLKMKSKFEVVNCIYKVEIGDNMLCVASLDDSFLKGNIYNVTTNGGHLAIIDELGYFTPITHGVSGKFEIIKKEVKQLTIATPVKATAIVIVETITGGKDMRKGTKLEATVGMNLDGATVKRANGGTVIEKPFNFFELTTDMQVFDTLLNKWRTVRYMGMTGFIAGNSTKRSRYTDLGKLDIRHTVVAIDRMRTKITDIATVEKLVTNKFNKVEWKDGGEKNFYVIFKSDVNEYSVFSEDKLRRINTLFFSRDDAFKVKKQLNTLLGISK